MTDEMATEAAGPDYEYAESDAASDDSDEKESVRLTLWKQWVTLTFDLAFCRAFRWAKPLTER